MKKRSKLLAVLLSAVMVVGAMLPAAQLVSAATVEKGPDKLPGTTSTEASYNTSFLSVTGFAKGYVNDRTEYIGTSYYRTADNEEQFLKAIDDAKAGLVKVIEITADLDLGWDALSDTAKSSNCILEYPQSIHGTDIFNPSILTSGVSKLNIADINGLTIFSKSGNTVKHAEWTLQNSTRDIVIRNLRFDGMWHWSEGSSSKEAGWTLMKIYAKGVWIDHCAFTLGADGCVDSENGAENVTISWCTYSMPSTETPDKNTSLYQTISYMEYLYQAGKLSADGRYSKLRANGASVEKILAYEAYHNKCNLNGSGDKDFMDGYDNNGTCLEDGNQRLHLTQAYNYVTNIGQRFPLLRQGTMHLMNCYLDNSGHVELQASAPFNSYGGWSSNRAINARDGASVGADNCVFNGLHAINGTETQYVGYPNMNEGWDVAFQNALNHALVVNSKVVYGGQTYIGSSWDNDGDNLFMESPSSFWNGGKQTIGNFYWYSSIVDEGYTRGVIPKDEDGNYKAFQFTYSEEGLPYTYQLLPLDEVETTIPTYAGPYVYSEDANFWLRTEYQSGEGFTAVDKTKTIPATDVHLSKESVQLDVGGIVQLTADLIPSNTTERDVVWNSSDDSVAEVKDSGLVIAKNGGKATITVTAADGTIQKTCEVTVNVGVEKIIIEAPTKTIYLGEGDVPADSLQLSAVVTPEDATDSSVIWESSNENILTVDENGVVTPVKKGATNVSCISVSNPDVSAMIRITVKEGANPNPATPEPTDTPEPIGTPEPTATPEPAVVYGDVDNNGKIEAVDALMTLKAVVKLVTLDDTQIKAADVDGDGTIAAGDALLILKKVVDLIQEFPVEEQ